MGRALNKSSPFALYPPPAAESLRPVWGAYPIIQTPRRTMMKLLYGLAALAMMTSGALAQNPVHVLENVQLSSNSVEDEVRTLTFGFGAEYTDTADFAQGEQILPPFFPPEGFFAFFGIRDGRGSEDFGPKDVRGIPDSVTQRGLDYFSLEYIIRLSRGFGQEITITFPFRLVRGIDSVRFESIQAGANFSHTFTEEAGAGQVKIPNNLITSLRMIVFYNYERVLSVPAVADARDEGLRLYPNPVRSGRSVRLEGALSAGGHLVVSDLYGSIVHTGELREGGAGMNLSLPALPSGAYTVQVRGEGGEVVRQGRLVVTE